MADPRHFAKLDLGYFDNPKIVDHMESRPRVPILHLRAILYCRQHLTDGLFPIRHVARLACASYCGSQCDAQCDFCACVQSELFIVHDDRTASVHDYLKHQDSAEQVANRKAAGQAGAASRWNANSSADRNANRNADRNAAPNAEKRREEKSNTGARSTDVEQEFDAWYDAYPRKEGRGRALKAYKAARKKVSAEELARSLDEQSHRLMEKGRDFCPHPSTWLNGERWADRFDEPVSLRPARYRDYGSEATA